MRGCLFFLLAAAAALFGQGLHWQLAGEGGFSQRQNNVPAVLNRLSASANVRHRFEPVQLEMRGRLSPEWDWGASRFNAVKFHGKIQLSGNFNRQFWRLFFHSRLFYYETEAETPVFFETEQFGAAIETPTGIKDQSASFTAAYARRSWDTYPANTTGQLLFSSALRFKLPFHTSISLLFNLNHFNIHARNHSETNSGWRMGPGLAFFHQNRFILDYSLSYYRTVSRLAARPGNTLFLHFMWGAFFRPKWSAFVYVDYQKTSPVDLNTPPALRFTPLETESWYYLKIEYDWRVHTSLYIKGGYFSDRLPDGYSIYSGTQILLGLRFKS